MSNVWFNIRILCWHFQIEYGDLLHCVVSFNPYHVSWGGLFVPLRFYAFRPREGWKRRHEIPDRKRICAARSEA